MWIPSHLPFGTWNPVRDAQRRAALLRAGHMGRRAQAAEPELVIRTEL